MIKLQFNGKLIEIPNNVEPALLAEIQRRIVADEDITEEFTNLIAKANGRIDNVLITLGDLKVRIAAKNPSLVS